MILTIAALAIFSVVMGLCVAAGIVDPRALDPIETEPVSWQRWQYVDRQFRAVRPERTEWPTFTIGGEQ